MFFLLIGCLLGLPVLAAAADEREADGLYREQLGASGANELWEELPTDTQAFLRDIGIDDFDVESYTALQPKAILDRIGAAFGQQAGGVVASCGVLLGIVILGAMAGGVRQTLKDGGMAETFTTLCATAACGTILLPMTECVQKVCAAADGVNVFMLSFIPVYAAVLIAGGQATLAASYSTVLLAGAEGVSALTTGVVTPMLSVSLGISAVGALGEKTRMGTLGALLAKAAGWLLATATGLFTALFSMQSLVAASADTLGMKAARMSLVNFIPVVGGALGETLTTVTGCLRLLRSTLGMFGILAAAALVLPSLCRCILWAAALALCRMAAEVLEVKPVTALLNAAAGVVKILIGVLAACGLFMIVTTTVVTAAGGK